MGAVLEKLETSTRTHFKHYIASPSGLVATYTRRSDATEDTFYFTKDHLGSTDSITNAGGSVQVRLSFDAFGKRRNESGWSGALPAGDLSAIANTSRRGFTEHEGLDNLGLIHMNGRVQDPAIGRFLSADPFVPHPRLSQSFNRHSYVRNNPLSITDPTGFADEEINFRRIAEHGYSWGGSAAFSFSGMVVTATRILPRPHSCIRARSRHLQCRRAAGEKEGLRLKRRKRRTKIQVRMTDARLCRTH